MRGTSDKRKFSKRNRMEQDKERFQAVILLTIDLTAILLSYFTGNFIRFGNIFKTGLEISDSTPLLFLLLVYCLIFFIRSSTKFFYQRGPFEELTIVVKSNIVLMAVLLIGFFCVKKSEGFSRLVFLYIAICNVLFMYTFRMLYKLYLIHVYNKSTNSKRLVILTTGLKAKEIIENLEQYNLWEYQIKAFILVDATDSDIGRHIEGVPVIGNYHNMYQCVTNEVVDEIFINVPYSSGVHVAEVIENYEDMGITVDLNIQVFDIDLRHRQKELKGFGGYYVIAFSQTVTTIEMAVIKRAMDIIGAIIGLILTGIVTIFVAPPLLIESKGPLFFSQIRVGKNGRLFKIYKFRSMYADAEERKKELMAKNKMKGLMFKMDNDPRITKVGKFIRKTSIDELPQFWNVLKGDMSLVGTRPPTMDEYMKYESKYKRRLSIRPGITGMWQVSGRSDITDFEEVLALDLEYIDNWSVGLDIKLLFKTIFVAFFGKGAE